MCYCAEHDSKNYENRIFRFEESKKEECHDEISRGTDQVHSLTTDAIRKISRQRDRAELEDGERDNRVEQKIATELQVSHSEREEKSSVYIEGRLLGEASQG